MDTDNPILLLINAFVERRLTAQEFERAYLALTQGPTDHMLLRHPQTGEIIEEADVAVLTLRNDCCLYAHDPELLATLRENEPSPGWYLDGDQLREKAKNTLDILIEIAGLTLEN